MGIVISNFENCKHRRDSKNPTQGVPHQEFNGIIFWFDPWIMTVAVPVDGILKCRG